MIFKTDHFARFFQFLSFHLFSPLMEHGKNCRNHQECHGQRQAHKVALMILLFIWSQQVESVSVTDDTMTQRARGSWSPWMTISQRCGNESTCCRSAMTQALLWKWLRAKNKRESRTGPPKQQKLSPCKVVTVPTSFQDLQLTALPPNVFQCVMLAFAAMLRSCPRQLGEIHLHPGTWPTTACNQFVGGLATHSPFCDLGILNDI